MPDIFDEVEEELRAERTRQFFIRYAGAILGLAVLAVAGVAGWQGWTWYQARQDQKAAALYIQAMLTAEPQNTAPDAKTAALGTFQNLAANAPEGYRALARLRAAAMEAEANHLPQALTLWNEVAADSSADPLLRELATLLWTQHQLDSGDPNILQARLKPLASGASPWAPLAQEQLALLDMRQGRTDQARQELTALAGNASAPDGVRQRATALLAQLAG